MHTFVSIYNLKYATFIYSYSNPALQNCQDKRHNSYSTTADSDMEGVVNFSDFSQMAGLWLENVNTAEPMEEDAR